MFDKTFIRVYDFIIDDPDFRMYQSSFDDSLESFKNLHGPDVVCLSLRSMNEYGFPGKDVYWQNKRKRKLPLTKPVATFLSATERLTEYEDDESYVIYDSADDYLSWGDGFDLFANDTYDDDDDDDDLYE